IPINMAPKPPPLTINTLQALLTRIGSATSGRKENLISRLSRDLEVPRFRGCAGSKKSLRILSIDMGIKNLAFCVADVDLKQSTSLGGSKTKAEIGTNMSIVSWRRIDVGEEVSRLIGERKAKMESMVNEEEIEDPYTPSTLSSTAYSLLAHTLLPYKPDVILIERQRWRSAGGVAVLQWTVRVNTLEGMLWAILTALRAESKSSSTQGGNSYTGDRDYDIFGVDPKRVGYFWIGEDVRATASKKSKPQMEDELILGPEGEVDEIPGAKNRPVVKILSRGKAEKQAKIQLLRSWLTPHVPSTVAALPKGSRGGVDSTRTAIDFEFSTEAQITRASLCSAERVKGGRRNIKVDGLDLKKLDDVTDCFLQAAAWVAWETNRAKMVHEWDSKQGQLRSQGVFAGEVEEEAKPKVKAKKTAKIKMARSDALKTGGRRTRKTTAEGS
ncbi:ribonuclease H-like protein, partial [Pleomassaria siparia CBS 279.74]